MSRNLLLLREPTSASLVAKEVACCIAAQGNCNVAAAKVDEIATYFKNHRIEAMQYAIESRADRRDVILDKLEETGASPDVARAFGASSWRRSIFGSVGDYLIRYCPVPLFSCQ